MYLAKIIITSLPVISNFAILYVFIPSVLTYYDQVKFESVILIYTFFSASGALTLGIPIMLTKEASSGKIVRGEEWSYIYFPIIILLAYTLFFFIKNPEYYYLLFFIPILVYVSLRRGVEEGLKNFFKSAFLRIIFFIVLPLILFINDIKSEGLEYKLSIFSFSLFLLYTIIFSNKYIKINILTRIRKITPYAIQSIYVFLFIFIDRALLWTTNPEINISQFTYEYEFVYRAIMPYTLVLIVLFPYMTSSCHKEIKKTNKSAILYLILFFIIYIAIVFNLKEIYSYLGINLPSTLLQYNSSFMLMVITSLCLGVFLQRKIIAIGTRKQIATVFSFTILLVIPAGIMSTVLFGSALKTIAVKIVIEIFILFYFIRKFTYARYRVNKQK